MMGALNDGYLKRFVLSAGDFSFCEAMKKYNYILEEI